MADSNVMSLFGITPEAYQQKQNEALQAEALRFAQLDPFQQASMGAYMAGSRLGSGIGGLLGAEDPQLKAIRAQQGLLQGVDISDPAALRAAASKAMQSGQYGAASQLASKALDIEKEQSIIAKNMRERQAASLDEKLFLEVAKKADPASVAEARKAGNDISLLKITGDDKISTYGQVLKDAGLTPGTPQFQLKMGEFATAELQSTREGKGTKIIMPGAGAAKVSDVATFGSQVNTVLKPFKEDYEVADTALKMIETNNPKAAAQVDRALARASGDSQLSQTEVLAVASAGSFPQRAVDSISKFFTGGSGQLSVDQKRDVLEAFKNAAAKRHDAEQQRLNNLFSTSELSKQQVEAGLGKRLSMQTSFNSVAEAEAANLPKGTKITIGGRQAIVE
jgi:hypothetical protein